MSIEDRTVKALGRQIMEKLRSLDCCIVGCGGTGASFAEMLVRSGATKLTLIDGSAVKESGLNRVTAFCLDDVGKPKVNALEKRLHTIRKGLNITALNDSFRKEEELVSEFQEMGRRVRDAVHDADFVFIATDTNPSRLAIEKLLLSRPSSKSAMCLSCGVHVDGQTGTYSFECTWSPKTPDSAADREGYGPENASYIAIVQEATAMSFTMLLSQLSSQGDGFTSYSRRYDAHFVPVETCVTGTSSNSRRRRQ